MRAASFGLAWVMVAALLAGCGQSTGRTSTTAVAPAKAASQDGVSGFPTASPVRQGFAGLADRGELLDYPGHVSRRDGAYTWHRAALSEEHALHAIRSGYLRVATPSGAPLLVQYDRHIEHPSGDWTWIGHIPGHPGDQTILTFGAQAAFGSIGQSGQPPLRLTVRNGMSWLVETDPTKVAGINNAATRPTRPDYRIPPRSDADGGLPSDGAPTQASAPVTASATATATTTVDLVLGYTTGFANDYGGTSGAITRLNYLVDVANTAYTNSQITPRVRLVRTVAVNYADNTSNDSTLDQLTGYNSATNSRTTANPAFNALRAAREQYGADLVALVRSFREPENGGCGLGWLLGGGQSGIASSDSYYGYSVLGDGSDAGTDGHNYYCLDETLAHELGHNMGAQHDAETAKGDDGTLDAGDYGVYSYSFGYKNNTYGFYTVMAYGDSGQHIFRIFSDPRSTFCGGQACGSSAADNARTLAQTMPIIAGFRATVVATARVVHNDVDNDGRSDLLFHEAATRQFSYRLMSGSTTLSSKLINDVGAGYYVAATGDFNGDGRTDLVWTSSTRRIYLWLASGTGFASSLVGNYPTGWALVGAGDVDGDGLADLMFHNATTREFSYRIMSGTNTVRSTLISGVGDGYHVAAIGDFNGDGHADIAWTSNALDLYIWLGNGTTFGSVRSNDYPVGWSIAGAGDIDADGNDDLLFINSSANQFNYRIMRGATRVRSTTFNIGPGYRIATLGDFNGDKHLDITWTSAARDLAMWFGNGTGFTGARAGSYPDGWAVVR